MRKSSLSHLLTIAILGFSGSLASSALAEPAEIKSPDVYQNVGILLNEVEQIRLVLGQRLPRSRTFGLEDVEPRQVFFQAQTLFRKCNQLAQEQANLSRQPAAPAPDRDIIPADVYAMVSAAREQLAYVKEALNIKAAAEIPRLQSRRKSADVMHDIIEAGYVINAMTASTPGWPGIYERVLQMIGYVGGALPEAGRYPDLEKPECCKMPQDVYQRLAATMDLARPAAKKVNLSLVRVVPGKASEGGASTSTVYDLTTTMISDFAELTLRLEAGEVAAPEYPRPPRIFPSHVYQLAGTLEAQITQLAENSQ